MYGQEVEKIIEEYLKNSKAKYAIMIDGDWGSGKTYFLTHSLMKLIEDKKLTEKQKRKYAYVSLYGMKSISEVSKKILFQYFGKRNEKKAELANEVIETATQVLTATLEDVIIDFSKIEKRLEKIDIKNWIICFDDLERCSLPIDEILGYINQLVEHNGCKVIILANEKEIGKISLNRRIEEKYKVILSGKTLRLDRQSNTNNSVPADSLDKKGMEEGVKEIFGEDVLYKTIREKVIGLTIGFKPKMDEAYNSIMSDFSKDKNFENYLTENKATILELFAKQDCCNLRTLISVFESLKKIYDKMGEYNYNTVQYYKEIMREFLEYVVMFTIFYKNGGKASDLGLTSEIGQVYFGIDGYLRTRGFKFIEKYCTVMSFDTDEFIRVVTVLRQEKEERDKKEKQSKIGLGKAYGELTYWWQLEDEEVSEWVEKLREEIAQDCYPFSNYQGIIGQLLVLAEKKFDVGDLEDWVAIMNRNINKSEENVDIERNSFNFKDNLQLRKRYDELVGKLELGAKEKNRSINSAEIMNYVSSDNWVEDLLKYCDNHYNDFLNRYGFIDLIDIDVLTEKIRSASTKDIYLVVKIFRTIYKASNIRMVFRNDLEQIIQFRDKIGEIKFTGINKPAAIENLIEYLNDIIMRLSEGEE